ncbi:MAG: hypothetical protein J1G02_05410 [Clostridiales bacterium]|nr:hypothetical protein [Clostridiales bacterium]
MPSEKHSFSFDNNIFTVKGVKQVMEISEKQASFKLENNTLTVKGSGLNVIKLDKEQGVVVLEVSSLTSLGYRQSGVSIKGLFR